MAKSLPGKIAEQVKKAGLPTGGAMPFVPQIDHNQNGNPVIRKSQVLHGPKQGKLGYVDTSGRIWIKDRAHASLPDHWDVQENGGKKGYVRVDLQGNVLP